MQKVCCIGTHGVGKTTLSYQQATYYKEKGKNVKLINEIARSCPFALNDQFNAYGAMWIIHAHLQKELEAMSRNADIIICDRSPIDSVMYGLTNGCGVGHQIKNLYKLAEDWMETYDKIYYVKLDGNDSIPDGIRSNNEAFRKKVENHFEEWMDKCHRSIQQKIILITSSKIFSVKNCWLTEPV